MDSPCIQVCTYDPSTDLCLGCGRTLDEISGWWDFDAARRQEILAQLPARLAEMRVKPD